MAKVTYETITDDDFNLQLAQQLHGREQEHRDYSRNTDMFRSLLNTLESQGISKNWPEDIKQCKGMSRDQIIAEIIDNDVLQEKALDYAHYLQIHLRWKAEKHEAKRLEMYKDQVAAMLPVNKAARDAILANAKAKRDADALKG